MVVVVEPSWWSAYYNLLVRLRVESKIISPWMSRFDEGFGG